MEREADLHKGHRDRMLNKFASNPDAFSEHQLLEILLFYFIPRKDTNEIAHRLLRDFGSISRVFSATAQELCSVEGIGKRTAEGLLLFGKLMDATCKKQKKNMKLGTFAQVKANLKEFFLDENEERVMLVLLNEKYKEMAKIDFCDKNVSSVSAEIPDIAKAFALHKPKFALIAHNHPSGSVSPSGVDDMTTKKINILCGVHGVTLIDHIIFAKDDAFSYNDDGRLEKIKQVADIHKILSNQGGLL